MSIETDLNSIAKSLATIAAHLTAIPTAAIKLAEHLETAKAPVAEPPKPATLPVMTPTVESVSTVATTATVPTVVPVTLSPATAQPTVSGSITGVPFDSAASLTAYVMNAYKTLGPIKGAKIQEVLQSVGAKNINEVKPEQYATVKAGVDALGV